MYIEVIRNDYQTDKEKDKILIALKIHIFIQKCKKKSSYIYDLNNFTVKKLIISESKEINEFK